MIKLCYDYSASNACKYSSNSAGKIFGLSNSKRLRVKIMCDKVSISHFRKTIQVHNSALKLAVNRQPGDRGGRLVEHYRSDEPIVKSQDAAERRKIFRIFFV